MKRAAALFVLLGAVLLAGTWRAPDHLGAKDWNWFLGQTEAEVTSLLHYGQFPLWSPWRHGGQVCFAQPESMFLSPVTLLALCVGTLLAYKLLLLPVYVAGALGMVALAGELGLSGRARLVPALVFFLSSVVPLYVLAGLPNWLCALALLPWLLWALRRARRDLRWLLLAGLLDAGLLCCGAIFWFTLFPLLLLLDGASASALERSARPVLLALVALLLGAVLAAPRIVPLFEVHGEHPRDVAATGYFLPPSLALPAWLSTDWPDLSTPNGSFVVTDESAVYWPYVGAWIGPLALALAALGALAGGRRALVWLLSGAACFWAACGSGVRPSLWDALHALPGIGSMHVPARLLLLTTFCLALLAGFGWERVERWLARAGRPADALALGLLALLVAPMLWVNAPLSAQAFTVAPTPGLAFAPQFRQARVPQRPEQWLGEAYESVRSNVGNPLAATDIPTAPAVRTDREPGYRGEVYTLSGRGELHADLTPNRIEVALDLPQDDLLVVNQNAFPGWRAELATHAAPDLAPRDDTPRDDTPQNTAPRDAAAPRDEPASAAVGEVQAHEGLLALPVGAGRTRLTLVFDPPGVRQGAILGALGVLLGVAWLRARRGTGRGGFTRPQWPEWSALGGYALLALVVAGHWTRPAEEGGALLAADETAAWLSAGTLVQEPPGAGGVRDLQPFLDAQPAGALLLLPPGRYSGCAIPRGVSLVALPGGVASLEGPVTLADLPATARVTLAALPGGELRLRAGLVARDCAGELLLQRVELEPLAGSACFAAERCARVVLLGVTGGAVSLRACGASVLRCELTGEPGLAALDALQSTLLLRDGHVAGGAGGLAAVRVQGGTLRAGAGDPDGGAMLSAAGAPALLLQRGARAVLSGLPESALRAQLEPGCSLERTSALFPEIRLVESRYGGGTLLLELSGLPGSSGVVILSRTSVLNALPALPALPDGAVLVADPRESTLLPVTLPASGRLSQRLQIPPALRRPGGAVFVQFAAGSAGRWQLSLPDAALLALRGERR